MRMASYTYKQKEKKNCKGIFAQNVFAFSFVQNINDIAVARIIK